MGQIEVLEQASRPLCKNCASFDVARMGFSSRKRHQRYLCHSCERTFVDNGAPPGMKSPIPVIASALTQFYQDAASLPAIRRFLLRQHGVQSDQSNIRRWVMRYTLQAVMALAGMRPQVGQEWVVHETCIATKMFRAWLWDVMDIQTGFLLASGFSTRRGALNVEALLDLAMRRTSSKPEILFTNMVLPPQEGLEIRVPTIRALKTLELMEHRTPILQRLTGRRVAALAVSGWAVHYNFFRQSKELKGKTPAEAAGLEPLLKNWTDVVMM